MMVNEKKGDGWLRNQLMVINFSIQAYCKLAKSGGRSVDGAQ